jgi:HAD superfamily hydrolase (TIGR01549 family)
MSGREIDVITFDLDDTLWAVGPVIIKAEKALWKWLNEHCPRMTKRYDREKLMPLRSFVIERDPRLKHDISSLRTRVLTEALSRSGHGDESETLAKTAFEVFMHERHAVEYFEHVLPVLEQLKQEFRLGVISNGNADVYRLDIGRFFEFAIAAGDVGASKPNRVVFDAALNAAKCAPENIVHIGDNHEADIAGAQAMGMATVWVNIKGIRYPGGPKPDREITSLDELPEAIQKIANG